MAGAEIGLALIIHESKIGSKELADWIPPFDHLSEPPNDAWMIQITIVPNEC